MIGDFIFRNFKLLKCSIIYIFQTKTSYQEFLSVLNQNYLWNICSTAILKVLSNFFEFQKSGACGFIRDAFRFFKMLLVFFVPFLFKDFASFRPSPLPGAATKFFFDCFHLLLQNIHAIVDRGQNEL
jgi:hypothetical protein